MFNNALRPIAVRRRFALTHPARLIEHHGDSILRLAGIRKIVDWRPVPGEVVQPRQLPIRALWWHGLDAD